MGDKNLKKNKSSKNPGIQCANSYTIGFRIRNSKKNILFSKLACVKLPTPKNFNQFSGFENRFLRKDPTFPEKVKISKKKNPKK